MSTVQWRRMLLVSGLAVSSISFAQSPVVPTAPAPTVIDVRNYGAFCDNGHHDDTQGFRAAILAADDAPFARITYPPN